ncbi:hypothetical protein Gotur_030762 [Gossypium turneri]
MEPDRAVMDDVESNTPASAQRAVPEESRHETHSEDEAREAFLRMMSNWYIEFVRVNSNAQLPPPPPIPQPVLVAPQSVDLVRSSKPPVDKIRKHGAEDFRANVGDDLEKAEFWLENTIRVFDELSCTSDECLKCAVSLVKDSAYQLKEFVVLVDRACKAEELSKEKRRAEIEARDVRKRSMSRTFQSQPKKLKGMDPRSTGSAGYSRRDRGKSYPGAKTQTTSMASVGNVGNTRPECQQCGRRHAGKY